MTQTTQSRLFGGRALTVAVTLLALAAVAYVLHLTNTYPSTDDAFVQADTIGVAAQVSGRIVDMKVRDNAPVHRGDILFVIDARPFELDAERLRAQLDTLEKQIRLTQRQVDAQRYAADASRSGIARARANVAQRESTLSRMEPLLKDQFVTGEQVDQARTARDTALAELDAAQADRKRALSAVSGTEALIAQRRELAAAIARADYMVEQAVVRAPFDGRVVDLHVANGEYAAAGKPVFTLIDTHTWHVVANFRETELRGLQAGSPARVYVMSDPDRQFAGVVDSIGWAVLPDEGSSAQGLPKVPRSINWVHVAQRFPVRIRITSPVSAPLRIGASAVAVLARDKTGQP